MRTAGRKHRTARSAAAVVAAVAAGVSCLAVGPAAQAVSPPGWTVQRTPALSGTLLSVARLDAHTTLAVGNIMVVKGPGRPLLLSRDDRDHRGWRVVPTPEDARTGDIYSSVSASSTKDAWVTGVSFTGLTVPAEHWNGRTWQTAEVPVPAHSGAGVHVAAVSPGDAWAAGWYFPTGASETRPLLRHWTGAGWHAVALPHGSDVANLVSVTATSAHDVWAVGYSTRDQPRVLHYDGRTWTQVAKLGFHGLYGEVGGVAAHGPNDVWAVGRVLTGEHDRGHALVLHWDGHAWHQVTAPRDAGPLASVTLTPQGILAVGENAAQTAGIALRSTATGLAEQALPRVAGTSPDPVAVTSEGNRITVVGELMPPTAALPSPLILAEP
ncbi:hypothetical protein [Streptacidiphilus jiangxiensis]|uniref:Uncharacterized protein n=1 Tax=Streptacidiphilus jiangxiensis TaxID=235985 RepID=A0A1H7RMH7_STRJI|nr:hypothetical protein [Streptacidiphilus jiangxiensis]SEL61238.1 hypothetical protein SAMN05414137_110206 [Streptacidiphilus jiangxiensis]